MALLQLFPEVMDEGSSLVALLVKHWLCLPARLCLMEGVPPVVFLTGSSKPKHGSASSRESGGQAASFSRGWVGPTPKWKAAGKGSRARSRSPPAPALPGLRFGAPSRRERIVARVPDIRDPETRERALADLDKDVKANPRMFRMIVA